MWDRIGEKMRKEWGGMGLEVGQACSSSRRNAFKTVMCLHGRRPLRCQRYQNSSSASAPPAAVRLSGPAGQANTYLIHTAPLRATRRERTVQRNDFSRADSSHYSGVRTLDNSYTARKPAFLI
ncbi:hypothetical protein MHYP_G00278820 [Metynnis hypsauchen]